MNYSKQQRDNMREHLDLEKRFCPLNVRRPSFWERESEFIGILLWCVAVALSSVIGIMAFGMCPR